MCGEALLEKWAQRGFTARVVPANGQTGSRAMNVIADLDGRRWVGQRLTHGQL